MNLIKIKTQLQKIALADEGVPFQSMRGGALFFFLIVKGVWKLKGKFRSEAKKAFVKLSLQWS